MANRTEWNFIYTGSAQRELSRINASWKDGENLMHQVHKQAGKSAMVAPCINSIKFFICPTNTQKKKLC